MLISVHFPKTAGSSFLVALESYFGQGLLQDYADRPINRTALRRNAQAVYAGLRNAVARTGMEKVACIHGHFLPLKYALLPVAAGISLFTPVGGWIAAHGDPTVIRWCISAIVFLAILLLTTGVKWHGRETLPVTLAVGALSGTFGGMAALSGIVVVIYWLARDLDPAILRRNMFTLLLLTAVVQAVTFALNGLLTEQVFAISALMLLPYVAGTFIGSMVFPLASPRTFRKIVYGMILCSGIVGLPLFDPWLGR